MDQVRRRKAPERRDERVIIHFVRSPAAINAAHTDIDKDYDCFYASVFEAENPALKSLPLAVQQKHVSLAFSSTLDPRLIPSRSLSPATMKLEAEAFTSFS